MHLFDVEARAPPFLKKNQSMHMATSINLLRVYQVLQATTSHLMATSIKVAASIALGYLDIGTSAITSYEYSASSTVQATAMQLHPRRSRSDCRGVSACWFLRLRFLFSLTVHDATVVHVTIAMTWGGGLEILLVTY
jgi:hypothetical protein